MKNSSTSSMNALASKHERTKGPWAVGEKGRMIVREVPGMCDGGDYYSVAVTTAHSLLLDDEAKANAAFIVLACNSHDALVEALEGLLKAEHARDAALCGHDGRAILNASNRMSIACIKACDLLASVRDKDSALSLAKTEG